ncbi:MAG: glycerol-3-phosphate 1-O-acyltransferase PlsY [Thermoanaerobaculia bacterium]
MSDQVSWILLTAGCFLLGSIPFSFLVARATTGRDLREVGSGNPGATNALRTAGAAAGLIGLFLDTAKGFVPTWLARGVELPDAMIAAVALACVVGHVTSPFLGFRGGKGVATGFGALVALNPLGGLLALGLFVASVAISRIVSLGSILAVTVLPLIWFVPDRLGAPPAGGKAGWLAAVAICALVLARHVPNLRRLLSGTEKRLGAKPA